MAHTHTSKPELGPVVCTLRIVGDPHVQKLAIREIRMTRVVNGVCHTPGGCKVRMWYKGYEDVKEIQ